MTWIRDLVKLMSSATASMLGKPPPPALARNEIGGLIVSTAATYDMGYETAIVDAEGAYPVERYAAEAEALAGHQKWVERAPGLTTVRRLGYGDLIDEEDIVLQRRT
jgi:hypothetical protein